MNNPVSDNIIVRDVSHEDTERLLEIYAYYVENTAISFEYDVPSLEEFQSRISNTTRKYPYLVIEKDGKIKGYAYAHPFVERAAYDLDGKIIGKHLENQSGEEEEKSI